MASQQEKNVESYCFDQPDDNIADNSSSSWVLIINDAKQIDKTLNNQTFIESFHILLRSSNYFALFLHLK
jgi:hypothetical protein